MIFPRQVALVDADQGRHVVSHCVHRVVGLVAVECPVAFLVGDKLDWRICPTAMSIVTSCQRVLAGPPVGAGDQEFVAVQVDRMARHG